MTVVFESTFLEVKVDARAGILWFSRTSKPFSSAREVASAFAEALAAMNGFHRAQYRLLIDMREGPLRNEPEFEAPLGLARERVLRGFQRAAVLVKTATGALQVKRHIREDKLTVGVFYAEEEAVSFLREPRRA